MKNKFLTKEFYIAAHEKYGCYPNTLELLCQAVEEIATNEERKDLFFALLQQIQTEKRYDGEPYLSDEMDMLPALAVAACMPEMIENLVKDGFPRENAEKTAREIDAEIVEPMEYGGNPGLRASLVKWFCKYLRREIIRIGRFNFERVEHFKGKIRVYKNAKREFLTLAWNFPVNAEGGAVQAGEEEVYFAEGKEEDGLIIAHKIVDSLVDPAVTVLEEKDWELVLQEGDPAVHLHIPAGEDFSPSYVNQSYEEGLELLAKSWSNLKPKTMACKSWLMDPGLRELLKPSSNILAFQEPFTRFTSRADATAAIHCVFHRNTEDYASLPENSSLQRAMKQYYLDGKRIRHFFGYWLLEDGKLIRK